MRKQALACNGSRDAVVSEVSDAADSHESAAIHRRAYRSNDPYGARLPRRRRAGVGSGGSGSAVGALGARGGRAAGRGAMRRDATRCDAMRCDAMRRGATRCDAVRSRMATAYTSVCRNSTTTRQTITCAQILPASTSISDAVASHYCRLKGGARTAPVPRPRRTQRSLRGITNRSAV